MADFDNHFEVSGPVNAMKGFMGLLGVNGGINPELLSLLAGNEPDESDDFEWVLNEDLYGLDDVECTFTIGETMAWAHWYIMGGSSWDGEDVRKLSAAFKDLDFIHGFTRDATLSYFNHFKNGELVNCYGYGDGLLALSLVAIDSHTQLTGSEKAERIIKEIDDLDISILDWENAFELLCDEDTTWEDNICLVANDVLLMNTVLDRLDQNFYQGLSKATLKKIKQIKKHAKALIDYEGEFPETNPNKWSDEERENNDYDY